MIGTCPRCRKGTLLTQLSGGTCGICSNFRKPVLVCPVQVNGVNCGFIGDQACIERLEAKRQADVDRLNQFKPGAPDEG